MEKTIKSSPFFYSSIIMATIKAKNIYYFYYINAIGGIETFYYYLAKKYYDKDFRC